MSKINPLQAAALKTPVKKITATKPPVVKTQAAKAVTTGSTIKKVTTTNPIKTPSLAKNSPTKIAPNKVVKVKIAKPVKEKMPKLKMERDSFTMPKIEYAQFSVLKERLIKLGQPAKKSELLRAGIMQLTAMTDAALKAAMSKVPTIKTGRPKKK